MKLVHALVPALLLAVGATSVSAKVLVALTRANNFTYSVDNTPVPLDSAGTTSTTFVAKRAGVYVLSYSAECSADNGAASTSGWVHIDVEVNGVVASPTAGGSDALCSANGVAGHDAWTRPAIVMPVTLVAGNNTVRVLGRFIAPVNNGWLGDSALVVAD